MLVKTSKQTEKGETLLADQKPSYLISALKKMVKSMAFLFLFTWISDEFMRTELKKWSSYLLGNLNDCLMCTWIFFFTPPPPFFFRCPYETIAEIVQEVWRPFF